MAPLPDLGKARNSTHGCFDPSVPSWSYHYTQDRTWTFSTASLYWNLLIRSAMKKNDLKLHKAGPRKLSPAPKFKKFWWGAKASTPSMLRMKPDASKDKESSCRVEILLKLRKNNRLAPGWGSNSTIITEIWRHPKTSKNVATHIQLFPKSPTRTSGVEFAWFTSLAVNCCKHKTKWKRLVDVNPPVESTTES